NTMDVQNVCRCRAKKFSQCRLRRIGRCNVLVIEIEKIFFKRICGIPLSVACSVCLHRDESSVLIVKSESIALVIVLAVLGPAILKSSGFRRFPAVCDAVAVRVNRQAYEQAVPGTAGGYQQGWIRLRIKRLGLYRSALPIGESAQVCHSSEILRTHNDSF